MPPYSPKKQLVLDSFFIALLKEIFRNDENIGLNISRMNRAFQSKVLSTDERVSRGPIVLDYNRRDGDTNSCSVFTSETLQDGMFERILNFLPRKSIKRMPEDEFERIVNGMNKVVVDDEKYGPSEVIDMSGWDGITEIDNLKQMREFNQADQFYDAVSPKKGGK